MGTAGTTIQTVMAVSADQAVLVPAVLGAGLLFSIATLVRDLAHRVRGRRWLDRRALIEGSASAVLVVADPGTARRCQAGLRSRLAYAVIAVGFVGLALYAAVGSWGNFAGWTWWAEGIAWLYCVMLAVSAGFTAIGIVAAALAVRRTDLPTWVRPVLVHTPLGRADGPADFGSLVPGLGVDASA
jgi:hypothetical protein